MANTNRSTYPVSSFQSQSELNFYTNPSQNLDMTGQVLRSLSPDDVQKLKYKIELDKQVAEKQLRLAREWEKKIERDKKYVQNQPFGRHQRTTLLKKEELEEILTRGRAPSPVLEMPQQFTLHQQQPPAYATETYLHNDNNNNSSNTYMTPRQTSFSNNNYSQYQNNTQSQTQIQQPNTNNSLPDFQRFYGPGTNLNSHTTTNTTAQPIKGDAHDPFLLYDPNKEGQNVFNVIPQQDLYDPWGRPGAGAPLIHVPTGQKFTRYSGSLQDKLNHVGPLGFSNRQNTGNLEEQKRDLELEQRRRQQEEMEHRSNITGARTRFRSEESRVLHDDLVRQAEERARMNRMDRQNNSLAELQHSEVMNNWWGKGGGGAPSYNTRRHNVKNELDNTRSQWTMNHLGQMTMTDDDTSGQIKIQSNEIYYPRNKQLSNHRNFYQIADDKAT